MYNLAHLYIFDKHTDNTINKSIKLLIESLNKGFEQSIDLLLLILIKRYGTNIDKMKKEHPECNTNKIITLINTSLLNSEEFLKQHYQIYINIDYLYNIKLEAITSNELIQKKSKDHLNKKNEEIELTLDFYEGFGKDII